MVCCLVWVEGAAEVFLRKSPVVLLVVAEGVGDGLGIVAGLRGLARKQ